MATSQKTLDQVKSILGKLDRNIDALRERRLGEPNIPGTRPPVPGMPGPALVPPGFAAAPNYNDMLIGRAAVPTPPAPAPAPSPAASPAAANSRSPYGRAQPLRGNDTND